MERFTNKRTIFVFVALMGLLLLAGLSYMGQGEAQAAPQPDRASVEMSVQAKTNFAWVIGGMCVIGILATLVLGHQSGGLDR